MNEQRLDVRTTGDVVAARRAGRDMARTLGFGSADQTRLATAISELARNVVQHAGSGTCTVSDESNGEFRRICVVVEDSGPGIGDLESALEDGFSTGGGLGAGLPGTRRLVTTFDIDSEPGHTCIRIVMQRTKS